MIAKTAADYAATVHHARRIFGEDSLSGCVYTSAKYAPLAAVRVSANGQINGFILDIWNVIFGMVAEQKPKTLLLGELFEQGTVGLTYFALDSRGNATDAKLAVLYECIVKKDGTGCGDAFPDLF